MKLAGGRLRNHPSRKGLTKPSKAGPVWTGEVRLNEDWLTQPLEWKSPRTIFVCAHGDLFHEDVPDEWIDRVFAVMALARHHTFQVLTKRAKRMQEYASAPEMRQRLYVAAQRLNWFIDCPHDGCYLGTERHWPGWPLPNVWKGASAEDQDRYDERRDYLETTPAALRFWSLEPLLGRIELDLGPHTCAPCAGSGSVPTFDPISFPGGAQCAACGGTGAIGPQVGWAIVGGESGHGARPMHPDWARSIRDQCRAACVPYFLKQWGAWQPAAPENALGLGKAPKEFGSLSPDGEFIRNTAIGIQSGSAVLMVNVGKKAAGRELDGQTWDEMPTAPGRVAA
jgi:protein gp37